MKTAFLAPDRSIAVEVERTALWRMLDLCESSGRLETGGILIGRYTKFRDRLVVTSVSDAPPDSVHGRFGFVRGVAGLGARLRRAWARGDYYVGEWHFHPASSPEPSGQDKKQILVFSQEPSYKCPTPALVVVGGLPPVDWSMTVFVVVRSQVVRLEAATVGSAAGTAFDRPL